MRLQSLNILAGIGFLVSLVSAQDASHWAQIASKAKNGVIKLDSNSYSAMIDNPNKDYSVVVELTAMGTQFKCAPCREFRPAFNLIASSWRRKPVYERDQHFFASLDFEDGQAIYQKLGLSTAPSVHFHPAVTGPNKSNKLGVVAFDLNRQGLHAQAFHQFLQPLLPPFDLHIPFNPLPLIFTSLSIVIGAIATYALWDYILPFIQSRILWGTFSIILILIFISGYMWNKIKNAPYVAAGENGQVSWIAAGFQNQLGMESQVVGSIYGLLSFCIIALTLFVPAQTSPIKQRIGVYLWLGLLIVVFGLLMRLFRIKNGGYPFWILF